MKTEALITEEQETERGIKLVAFLKLKEATHVPYGSKRAKKYSPPRYYTDWGTKTALGVYRCVEAIMEGKL